jgi:uncharacterized protein YgiM (DUF1202 family)
MKRKKKNNLQVTTWRNDKKDIIAILGDNKKLLMPAILIVAVLVTVIIAISANRRATQIAANTAAESASDTFEVPDATMEENAYPEVNALIENYYKATAEGDADTLSKIYKGLDETEILKAVAASEYIDDFENITVYTKPGPVEGSYVAYVYNEVKLYEYDGTVPGLETLYICTDDSGNLYINGDIADTNELDYLKQINVQADVIDLNNKVASSYNELVSGDEKLAELLTRMRSGLQVSVGEALASSEASTQEEEDSAAEASSEEPDTITITVRTLKATDVINIRSSDSETADILSKTTQGQEFKEIEALANGWSKVEYDGKEAYVKTEFFEVVAEEEKEIPNPNKNTGATESSSEASSESSSEASSEASSESSAAASASTTDSSSSSASSSSASSSASTSSSSGSSATVALTKTGKMTVKETVRLRKEASTEAEIITTLYPGASVNVVENNSNGWSKVEYNGSKGYIKSEFLGE